MTKLINNSFFVKYETKQENREILEAIKCLDIKELNHLSICEDVLNLRIITEAEYNRG